MCRESTCVFVVFVLVMNSKTFSVKARCYVYRVNRVVDVIVDMPLIVYALIFSIMAQ